MSRDEQAGETSIYEIVIHGHPASSTTAWLGELVVAGFANNECLLRSPRLDQAALYGVVARMRDLGLVLVSISRLPEDAQMGTGERSGAAREG